MPGIRFCDELYNCLVNSSYVMEVSDKNEVKRWDEIGNSDVQLYGSFEHDISALMSFVNIRFSVPERKRNQLLVPSGNDYLRPEQFFVLFNGSIYYAVCDTDGKF